MSRPRTPTGEELELWQKVAETVAPLAPAGKPPKSEIATKSAPLPPAPRKKPPAPPGPMPKMPKLLAPKPPPGLSPMDRRTRSRITRGSVAIDRRVDLHGLTQAAAERRLERFLRHAQEEDARVVLVITGKGKPSDDARSEERGVLRRMVPVWLSAPGIREVVVGFEEAGRSHGGGGALYVRLRRQR
jgi:DNA-nicking Smr family endonuclease